jgi:SCF-associated factor 1
MFICWGRPFRLVSPLVDNSSEDSTPIQVECGWAFSAVLTKSGNVLVWRPGGRMYDIIQSRNQEMDLEGDKRAHATEDGIIPCVTWDLEFDPIRLPEIPQLSKLRHIGEDDNNDEETRLVQIAGLDEHLVGLTNHGHVLKITVDDDSPTTQRTWQYVRFVRRDSTVWSQTESST